MNVKDIRKLAYFADDYDFSIQEQIKGLGLYTKYRLYYTYGMNTNLPITYCKPCFKADDNHYFIRCGHNIIFQGKEVREEIAEFEKEFNKISKSILETKQSIIGLLLVQNEIIKAEKL